jgi:hypothetical protein
MMKAFVIGALLLRTMTAQSTGSDVTPTMGDFSGLPTGTEDVIISQSPTNDAFGAGETPGDGMQSDNFGFAWLTADGASPTDDFGSEATPPADDDSAEFPADSEATPSPTDDGVMGAAVEPTISDEFSTPTDEAIPAEDGSSEPDATTQDFSTPTDAAENDSSDPDATIDDSSTLTDAAENGSSDAIDAETTTSSFVPFPDAPAPAGV